MKFIDSNIIAYAFYENEKRDKCREAILNGGVIDAVCLIEAFNIIELQTDREVAMRTIKGILKSNLIIIDIDTNIIFEALKKSNIYKKLKFLDLIHYTVASINNCSSIFSFDRDFDKLEIPRTDL
ncbi:type II toxin-antitoxin system VapC family toxin [archaeon]|nr:type II toxin-antitoxin system VapC family toxin [archaeon]